MLEFSKAKCLLDISVVMCPQTNHTSFICYSQKPLRFQLVIFENVQLSGMICVGWIEFFNFISWHFPLFTKAYIGHHQITFTSSASHIEFSQTILPILVNSYSFFHIQLKHQLLSKAIPDPEDQLSLGLVLYILEGEWEVKSNTSKKTAPLFTETKLI